MNSGDFQGCGVSQLGKVLPGEMVSIEQPREIAQRVVELEDSDEVKKKILTLTGKDGFARSL